MSAPRVAFFVTCLVDMFRPSVGFAAIKLLRDAGCVVEVPAGQTCCGQPAWNSGDRAHAQALARQTIAALEATGREVYTGAMGYLSPLAGLELSVAIRTLEVSRGRAWLGVGGGILFVPGLVLFLGLAQVEAEATSLLAIIPVAFVGAASQRRYGNFRMRDAIALGLLAIPGAIGGVAIVNAIPERTVEVLFALLMLYVAGQMVRRALAGPEAEVAEAVE